MQADFIDVAIADVDNSRRKFRASGLRARRVGFDTVLQPLQYFIPDFRARYRD